MCQERSCFISFHSLKDPKEKPSTNPLSRTSNALLCGKVWIFHGFTRGTCCLFWKGTDNFAIVIPERLMNSVVHSGRPTVIPARRQESEFWMLETELGWHFSCAANVYINCKWTCPFVFLSWKKYYETSAGTVMDGHNTASCKLRRFVRALLSLTYEGKGTQEIDCRCLSILRTNICVHAVTCWAPREIK